MNWAKFFQKHGNKLKIKSLYFKIFMKGPKKVVKYLKDAGAKIGKNVYVASVDVLGSEPYLVEIGDNSYLAHPTIRLFTHDGAVSKLKNMGLTQNSYDLFGKIVIGKNCFIGEGTKILKNVHIGDNCIVGAGSVVTKSFPSNSVIAGNPAKRVCSVKDYFEKNQKDFDDTHGWSAYKKRCYIEANMDKYDKMLEEKKIKQGITG